MWRRFGAGALGWWMMWAVVPAGAQVGEPPMPEPSGRGCCSWHGGVCGCVGGRVECCDGKLSPSCRC